MKKPVSFLKAMFKAGLAAADPMKTLPPHLPPVPEGRTVVIGAGKAAAAMARAVEKSRTLRGLSGVVVTQYGYGLPTKKIEVIEAAHPVPDSQGEDAARRILQSVKGLTKDDLVLCLVSGGGSALLSLPAQGLDPKENREIHKALVKSGAPIHEINCVRKHLSAIKGGRLALAALPASVATLVISDVPGDDPAVVASGPTLPDQTTSAQALKILDKYKISVSRTVRNWLENPSSETPKPDDPRFSSHLVKVVSCGSDAVRAAADFARKAGIRPIILGEHVEGEARVVGAAHGAEALRHLNDAPCILLSGGETTVTVKGTGRGGRNSEYILAAAMAAKGNPHIYGLAAATDGRDGSGDSAGAYFTPKTLAKAAREGFNPAAFLDNNDTYSFFAGVGGLVVTGPTRTNVNDIRALLVL